MLASWYAWLKTHVDFIKNKNEYNMLMLLGIRKGPGSKYFCVLLVEVTTVKLGHVICLPFRTKYTLYHFFFIMLIIFVIISFCLSVFVFGFLGGFQSLFMKSLIFVSWRLVNFDCDLHMICKIDIHLNNVRKKV